MTTPLLRMAKDASAAECREAIQVFEARLRELDGWVAWGEPSAGPPSPDEGAELPHSGILGHEGARDECPACQEGAELQAGLEEAVRRQTERVDSHEHDWLPTENLNWLICGICEEMTYTY